MNKVKARDIIKRILLILIATAILILGGKIFSEARSIHDLNGRISTEDGKTYMEITGGTNGEINGYVNYEDTDPVVYCVSHHDGSYSGTHKYEVECYIEISGKTAKKYQYDSNGNLYLTNTYTDSANAKMAFILGGKIENGSTALNIPGVNINTKGEGVLKHDAEYVKEIGFTDRQAALWLHFNYWSQKVGLDSRIWVKTSDNGGNNDITTNSINKQGVDLFNENAEKYANSLGSSGKASVSSTVDQVMTSNTNAGPFKFDFSGNITSIIVKDKDGKEISSGIQFIVNGKAVNVNEIGSEKEFYISNT